MKCVDFIMDEDVGETVRRRHLERKRAYHTNLLDVILLSKSMYLIKHQYFFLSHTRDVNRLRIVYVHP